MLSFLNYTYYEQANDPFCTDAVQREIKIGSFHALIINSCHPQILSSLGTRSDVLKVESDQAVHTALYVPHINKVSKSKCDKKGVGPGACGKVRVVTDDQVLEEEVEEKVEEMIGEVEEEEEEEKEEGERLEQQKEQVDNKKKSAKPIKEKPLKEEELEDMYEALIAGAKEEEDEEEEEGNGEDDEDEDEGEEESKYGDFGEKKHGKGYLHYIEQPSPDSWGLVRISEREPDYSRPYRYPSTAGEGVHVYILDTGIYVDHEEFEGRAHFSANFVDDEPDGDLGGHGTHVAGTIGGSQYGVAKKVHLHDVKILNRYGVGAISDFLAALEHVANHAGSKKAIINLSLSGPKSEIMDDAVKALVREVGVAIFAAAGNAVEDACDFSPSGSPDVFSIGATDIEDQLADFSSSGACVRLYAPGVGIRSAYIGGEAETDVKDGTSMSSPHVAGIAALFLSQNDYGSPYELYEEIESAATKNIISKMEDALSDSRNLLAYNSFR
ncbi:uncharacterized protein VTP21DRAFT_9307 [Calcarisporiella thermophila]|uniref:uncharacterized protein n=1 Tax=Calcarisporiella thermophila TaxID=911321 RepID=UPI0037432F7E